MLHGCNTATSISVQLLLDTDKIQLGWKSAIHKPFWLLSDFRCCGWDCFTMFSLTLGVSTMTSKFLKDVNKLGFTRFCLVIKWRWRFCTFSGLFMLGFPLNMLLDGCDCCGLKFTVSDINLKFKRMPWWLWSLLAVVKFLISHFWRNFFLLLNYLCDINKCHFLMLI